MFAAERGGILESQFQPGIRFSETQSPGLNWNISRYRRSHRGCQAAFLYRGDECDDPGIGGLANQPSAVVRWFIGIRWSSGVVRSDPFLPSGPFRSIRSVHSFHSGPSIEISRPIRPVHSIPFHSPGQVRRRRDSHVTEALRTGSASLLKGHPVSKGPYSRAADGLVIRHVYVATAASPVVSGPACQVGL